MFSRITIQQAESKDFSSLFLQRFDGGASSEFGLSMVGAAASANDMHSIHWSAYESVRRLGYFP